MGNAPTTLYRENDASSSNHQEIESRNPDETFEYCRDFLIVDRIKSSENIQSDYEKEGIPIELLPGEILLESEYFKDHRVFLTNYRLCVINKRQENIGTVPLMSIEDVNVVEPAEIIIVCKDGKIYRLSDMYICGAERFKKLLLKSIERESVAAAFAWTFAPKAMNEPWLVQKKREDYCLQEWNMFGFDPDFFKITDENEDFSITETYPSRLIVPKWMEREDLLRAREYRFLKRFPVIVYLLKETRAILLRSSQSKSGFLNWRCREDERILETVNEYTAKYSEEGSAPPSNVIIDARSYAAAWAHRAKGGGFENAENYGNCRSEFLGLPNLHNVRFAFEQMREELYSNKAGYKNQLTHTQWLQFLGGLISAADTCLDHLHRGTSVLVHSSDGSDRTTQIVALAKLLADERYRTLKGFEMLVQREWVEFGHKFAERNGVYGKDTEGRCPIFLQWLDAVWQIVRQHPIAFEFNAQYIIKLAQHTYSGLFGTFLFNSESDRMIETKKRVYHPISIWQFLGQHKEEVVNVLFDCTKTGRLYVKFGIRNLSLWREFYGSTDSSILNYVWSLAEGHLLKDTGTMQKSKSSESISSLGIPDALASGALTTAHSESNGHINSLNGGEHHPMETSIVESVIFRRDTAKTRSLRSRKSNIKDLVDNDGMVKFYDPTQEEARKRFKQMEADIKMREAKISDQKRQKSSTKKTHGSLCSKDQLMTREVSKTISIRPQDNDNSGLNAGSPSHNFSYVNLSVPSR